MKALDVLEYAFTDYTSNKFKTAMSSLGIIIGVMAIVVMLTLGDALYSGVSEQFGSLELDTLVVLPLSINMNGPPDMTAQKPPAKLTDRDVSIIMGTPGVTEVYPQISLSGATVTSKGENRTMSVSGIAPQYFSGRYSSLVDKGRYLSPSDKYSVVLGSKAANGTFGKEIRTGSYVKITNLYNGRSQDYVVVGVMKERNASILVGDPNTAVYMTKAGLKALSDQDTYSYIGVRADSVQNADAVATAVKDALNRLHKNEGFSVVTQKMFADLINQVFAMIKYTLAGIGAISLVVGGIGIMNVMMLTVKERTKEIGLMKAVGATTADVRSVFVAESAILGLFSGIMGVVIAAIIGAIVGYYAKLPVSVSWQNALIGILFGLAVTVVFGVYPANQAAKLDPIDALRTE
jgi:putative ABC transport system permease protein